ncbi:hypothetical protein MLJ87_23090 [Escherichia coli]|nr:hypothetical protein [Escherichia coli]
MFRKKKEFIDGQEYAVITRYYLRIGRRDVSVRKLAYLALFVALLALFIANKPEILLPVTQ